MAFSVLEELERKAVLREGGHRQRTRRGSAVGDQDSPPAPRTGEQMGIWYQASEPNGSITGNGYERAQTMVCLTSGLTY